MAYTAKDPCPPTAFSIPAGGGGAPYRGAPYKKMGVQFFFFKAIQRARRALQVEGTTVLSGGPNWENLCTKQIFTGNNLGGAGGGGVLTIWF